MEVKEMKSEDFRKKLKSLVVRIAGDRIIWYYKSATKGALRIIIEQAVISTVNGIFFLELEDDRILYKGKNPFGIYLRHATVCKLIPEKKLFGKHIIPAERKEVFSGRFENCIRRGRMPSAGDVITNVRSIISGKYHIGQTLELQSEGVAVFSISGIVSVQKEPTKIQLKIPSKS
jgi:hypothetical protein